MMLVQGMAVWGQHVLQLQRWKAICLMQTVAPLQRATSALRHGMLLV